MLGSIGEKKDHRKDGLSPERTTDKTSLYRKTHIFFGGGSEWGAPLSKLKPNRWTRAVVASWLQPA
jgi:hypothetical protein